MFKTKTKRKDNKLNTNSTKTRTPIIGLPYIRGLSQKLTPIFKQHLIGALHMPFNTPRSLLVHPDDKTKNYHKGVVVYKISCSDCGETYMGKQEEPSVIAITPSFHFAELNGEMYERYHEGSHDFAKVICSVNGAHH